MWILFLAGFKIWTRGHILTFFNILLITITIITSMSDLNAWYSLESFHCVCCCCFFQNKAIYNATMAQLMYMNIYTKLTDVLAKNTKTKQICQLHWWTFCLCFRYEGFRPEVRYRRDPYDDPYGERRTAYPEEPYRARGRGLLMEDPAYPPRSSRLEDPYERET